MIEPHNSFWGPFRKLVQLVEMLTPGASSALQRVVQVDQQQQTFKEKVTSETAVCSFDILPSNTNTHT